MDKLYKKIAQVFTDNKQVFIDRDLLPVRQCDIYMGQPDDPESFEMFLPGVFVDWSITPGGAGEQDLLQVDFHVLQEPGANSENYSERLTESMDYLLTLKTVKYLVNRLRSSTSTPLTYSGERPRITPFFKYHIASYKCYIDSDEGSINRPTDTDTEPNDLVVSKLGVQYQQPDELLSPIIDTF